MKKYITLIASFLIILFIVFYMINDFKNDKAYLISQGFDEYMMGKDFQGYDNYCKSPEEMGDGQELCEIFYSDFFPNPTFSININFGDNSVLTYQTEKKGLLKKEDSHVIIEPDTTTYSTYSYYCKVDENFNILEDSKNGDYCYTEDYKKFIKDHKEYIDDALEEFNTYYDNFNMARTLW